MASPLRSGKAIQSHRNGRVSQASRAGSTLDANVAARKACPPRQFSDDPITLMKAAVVMRAEVSIVLGEPRVLEVMPAPTHRPASEAEPG